MAGCDLEAAEEDGERWEGVVVAGYRRDAVRVEWMQRGERRQGRMPLAENPALEVVTYESAGMQVTPQMRAFREEWLGSRAR